MIIDIGSHITQGGEFKIKELLKGGGFGQAFKADQIKPIRREVVVKVPKPNIIADATFSKRFEREAQILGNIRHRNVVRIIGFLRFHNAQGDLCNMALIQELVEGAKPLHEYIAQDSSTAASVLLQTLYALRAFGEGVSPTVLHRDMSPNNILIGRDGVVKVIDFGLSKEDDGAGGSSGLTAVGQWFGTPGCMSPEQCLDSKSVDHRTDLFAVGRSFMAALQARDPRFVDPTLVQEPWRTICVKLCEHDADKRYQTPTESMSAAMKLFVQHGTRITDFTVHVEEHSGQPFVDGWPALCLSHFEGLGKITLKDLRDAASIRRDALRAPGMNPGRMFELFEGSDAIKAFEAGTADFEQGDHLGELYGKLYEHLADRDKVHCFARVCRNAVRLHRFAMMDTCRRIFSYEKQQGIRSQLFAELEKADPGRVIESRGVFPR
jgi:serine/threonine protein kinase